MGQHKNTNRKPLATRWILSTKWFVEEADKGVKEYWTPIGQPEYYAGRKRIGGIPFEYANEEEARSAMKDIANLKFDENRMPNLMFVALEVKYVPKRIKIYSNDWFKKYVKKEVRLELVRPNFTDIINP